MGYSATKPNTLSGSSPRTIAAMASMTGTARFALIPSQCGSSTVSMTPLTYMSSAPTCSSIALGSPRSVAIKSSKRFIVWALASISLWQSMAYAPKNPPTAESDRWR